MTTSELRESHARLLAACTIFVKASADALEHWDAGRDAKVGKLLSAMAGGLKGYRADLTEAHAAMEGAERVNEEEQAWSIVP